MSALCDAIRFNADGLVSAIAVDADDGSVLMQAWMNREALAATVARGEMVYYSRSRQCLWHKGESSGHTQQVVELFLDCDGDALLARVRQQGGIACHTGRKSCFYRKWDNGAWHDAAPVLKSAEDIYGTS
ncbi:MAG: phosphoribosyl-AMP cyclohydrolase [Cardiobacteriaceae bacterium]|nr:phosphoribosyl-AMP cyclohydrolase [Cardiobacteriaceae bacterium]